MCSWCWAFRPVWQAVLQRLPDDITIKQLLGGLAPDTQQPMPEELQHKIQDIWKKIQAAVPGTEFNYDFWQVCQPRRSTYPACRAVIAAANQGKDFENAMILAIQKAYYLQARNPSNDDVLIGLSGDLGIDTNVFENDLNSDETHQKLKGQMELSQRLGVRGFPSLILEDRNRLDYMTHEYRDANVILDKLIQHGSR